ncbi:hypothetical protein AB0K48_61415, partial [Nonomuraea sp. NPDC055795]
LSSREYITFWDALRRAEEAYGMATRMPGGRNKAAKQQKKNKKGRRVSGDPRKAALGKPAPSPEDDAAPPKKGGLLGNLGGGPKLPPGMQLPPGFDPSKFQLPGDDKK